MKKKSLITSLVLGALLTLSLGVYTLVTAIIALTTPHHYEVSLAYTSEQKIEAFANYSEEKGNLKFTYDGDSPILDYNAEGNYYTLKSGVFADDAPTGANVHFVATATTDKFGSTTKYDVKVYKQGTGNAEDDAYLIGNADGLTTFADKYAEDSTGLDYIELVHDVDMKGVEFKGIASVANPFTGTFNGKGYAVKDMTINIDKDNVLDFAGKTSASAETFTVSAGLFNRTANATINQVNLENAKINVNADIEEKLTADVTIGEDTLRINGIRLGLIVGTSSETTINGAVQVEDSEDVTNSKVNGEIVGYTNLVGTTANSGMGGVAGAMLLANDATDGVNNYDINVKITNAGNETKRSEYVGGVAGYIVSNTSGEVLVKDVKVTLDTDAKFNMNNRVGGVAARIEKSRVENVTVNITVADTNTTTTEFVRWIKEDNSFADLLSVGGVAAVANNSSFANIDVTIANTAFGRNAGAFYTLAGSTATNVTVTGSIVGYTADGFAFKVNNSNVYYQAETEQEVVAANVDLTAYYANGLVGNLANSDLEAQGAGVVKVIANIHPYGTEITDIDITDSAENAGLVGYFYVTNEATKDYQIANFNVEVNVDNGVNMAGLVAYMGTQTGDTYVKNGETVEAVAQNIAERTVALVNNKVVANFASHSTQNYNNAAAHKVAGAVGMIYANAIVSDNDVTINMNKDADATAYGFAMFGGLVARIAGENVTISGNKVVGEAYANNSVYTRTFNIGTESNPENKTYTQITAGGLVGVIAQITDKTIIAGKNFFADETTAANVYPADQLAQVDVSTISMTNNVVDVDITITYKQDEIMNLAGYRARSVGALIGLVMNTGAGSDVNPYTVIDVSTNIAAGTVTSDDKTYEYTASGSSCLYSNGFGQYNAKRQKAFVIGSSYDYTAIKGDFAEGWNINSVATEIPAESAE